MVREDTISIHNEIRPIQEHRIRMSRWWTITVPECTVHCAKRQEDKRADKFRQPSRESKCYRTRAIKRAELIPRRIRSEEPANDYGAGS